MERNNETFGEVLKRLREQKDVTLRELARKLDVSAPFLSDVEKNRRAPLTTERLNQAVTALNLSKSEERELMDAVATQKNTIAPDIPEYIIQRDYVSAALRTARDLDAGEEEWSKFIEDLKKKKG